MRGTGASCLSGESRGLLADGAVRRQPALYDSVFSSDTRDIPCAVAYTPIELQLYNQFARRTTALEITGTDQTDGTEGEDDDDADWVPPGNVRRVVWNAQFGDHHWIVASL